MFHTHGISRAKLQSNNHHQQTNTQLLTGRMPFLTHNQQCQSTEALIFNRSLLVTFYVSRLLWLWFWSWL